MFSTNPQWRWPLVSAALLFSFAVPVIQAREAARTREMRQLLSKKVQWSEISDPKVTFDEVLNILAQNNNLTFDINDQAFKDAEITDAAKIPIADPVPFPAMNAKLETVLKKILHRVSPSATYIIREDVIEITTIDAVRKEFFPDRASGPLPPLVSESFDKQPLETALKELSSATGRNIVLDGRVTQEAQTQVTAELTNAPLDTAVRLLVDMAGLKMVTLDNVLYVTSKENAQCLKEERESLLRKHTNNAKTDKPGGKSDKPIPPPARSASKTRSS